MDERKYRTSAELWREALERGQLRPKASRGGRRSGGSSEFNKEQALTGLEKLKNFGKKNSGLKNNPIKWDDDAAEADRINFSIKGDQRNKGKTKNVDSDLLRSSQIWVNYNGVKNTITKAKEHSFSSDMPVAVQLKGKYYLVDGNHRAAAAVLGGATKVKVRIIN